MAYYKKPRGRPRKGHTWDYDTGKWVPEVKEQKSEINVTKGLFNNMETPNKVGIRINEFFKIHSGSKIDDLDLKKMYENYKKQGGIYDFEEFSDLAVQYFPHQ